eukprot:UN00952
MGQHVGKQKRTIFFSLFFLKNRFFYYFYFKYTALILYFKNNH